MGNTIRNTRIARKFGILLSGIVLLYAFESAGEGKAEPNMDHRDYSSKPFKRMVILGESTVEGGAWLEDSSERYADILADLISAVQGEPIEYFNQGVGASVISPKSPGYEASRKPSAMEHYREDVIALKPDLFILAFGLNDMRAGMDPQLFKDEMVRIIRDVKSTCHPVIVLVNEIGRAHV